MSHRECSRIAVAVLGLSAALAAAAPPPGTAYRMIARYPIGGNDRTEPGARTLALDEKTDRIFMPTAHTGATPAGGGSGADRAGNHRAAGGRSPGAWLRVHGAAEISGCIQNEGLKRRSTGSPRYTATRPRTGKQRGRRCEIG